MAPLPRHLGLSQHPESQTVTPTIHHMEKKMKLLANRLVLWFINHLETGTDTLSGIGDIILSMGHRFRHVALLSVVLSCFIFIMPAGWRLYAVLLVFVFFSLFLAYQAVRMAVLASAIRKQVQKKEREEELSIIVSFGK